MWDLADVGTGMTGVTGAAMSWDNDLALGEFPPKCSWTFASNG